MADRHEIEALRLAVDIAAEMARYQRNTEARIVELSTAALRQAERDGALAALAKAIELCPVMNMGIRDKLAELRRRYEKGGD